MAPRETLSDASGEGLEARLGAADHDDLRLWLRIMTIHKQVSGEVRRRFREEFDTSLARFDLMANLVRHARGVRMGSLSDRLMVTGGNITQLVDHLEAEGLVERTPDPTSRRASLVCLTPKGRATFRSMARAHEKWMRELFAGLAGDEKKVLLSLLAKEKNFLSKAFGSKPEAPGRRRTRSILAE
jgi:DNA-binding MarR family transcriptional regulator